VILCAVEDMVVHDHGRPGVPMLFLTELWVPLHARGKGHAQSLLLAATEWADAARTDLWLYTAAYGDAPRLENKALAALYRRYGFVHKRSLQSPDYEMVRRYVRSRD
jgi:GNAT superfamily N-acetyltransferase